MTPCEEKGWEVGQVFEDERDGGLFVLDYDDGSSSPYFMSLGNTGARKGKICTPPIPKLKRICPPEEKSKKVEIVCDLEDFVVIKKADAKELNIL